MARPLRIQLKGALYHITSRGNESGHLFQGRYKSIIVDKDNYLLALVRYIHLNPIRIGETNNLEDYSFSSC